MVHGLVQTGEREGEPTIGTAETGGGGATVESHLDSFFEGSQWTREDVLLLLTVVQTVLFAYWLINYET